MEDVKPPSAQCDMARKDVLPGGPLHLAAPLAQAEYAVDVVKLPCQHSDLSNAV